MGLALHNRAIAEPLDLSDAGINVVYHPERERRGNYVPTVAAGYRSSRAVTDRRHPAGRTMRLVPARGEVDAFTRPELGIKGESRLYPWT